MTQSAPARLSFKARMHQTREDAIVQAVSRLLAGKGFDAMTVDEVAAEVGIAKASLYKHFPSKEALACAAMARVMRRAREFLQSLPAAAPPLDNIKAVARWTVEAQLAGDMPPLPGHHSSLRAALVNHRDCMEGLVDISDRLGAWIEAAQAQGVLSDGLPARVVLYTLYARACDPVLEFLKAGGQHADAQIADLVMSTCFEGLNAR